MTYANSDPGWNAQYFTPLWNIAFMMGQMTIMDGARQVYDRIKAACLHPDNLLGQAVILASLYMAADSVRHLRIGLALAVPATILLILGDIEYGPVLDLWAYPLILALYVFVIGLMLALSRHLNVEKDEEKS